MANNEEKLDIAKKASGVSRDVIVMVIVLLLILTYIFVEVYSATHVEVQTVTAITSTVYETIDAKALVIRDEHIIDSKSSGITVACVGDGEKVKVNGNIAMNFSNEDDAKKYSRALELQEELDYYINLESKSAGTATDIASIDKDIIGDVNSYVRQASRYTSGSLENSALELNDKLTRRQMIIGQEVDISSVKADLQKEINEINSTGCKPTGFVTTEESGIFSSYTDGCEGSFDYSKIDEIDVKALDSYFDKANSAQSTDSFGKLITNYEWYFCCKLDAEQVKNINDGDKLDVALKNSDQVIKCTVISGATVDLGTKETVLVLKSSEMNSQITSMRIEDIEIRFNEYTGFKVPANAVHVNDEGNKVVYALIANQVEERQGEIIYTTKDYVLFKYDPEQKDTIRLYDQIITQGKDLHDGKIYT